MKNHLNYLLGTGCMNSHGKYFWENEFAVCGLVNTIKSKVTQGLDLTGHRRLLN